MSEFEIPDEAARDAALALYPSGHHIFCAQPKKPCNCYFRNYVEQVRAAISVAYPILLAQITEGIVEKIEAERDASFDPTKALADSWHYGLRDAYYRAATIILAYGKVGA